MVLLMLLVLLMLSVLLLLFLLRAPGARQQTNEPMAIDCILVTPKHADSDDDDDYYILQLTVKVLISFQGRQKSA